MTLTRKGGKIPTQPLQLDINPGLVLDAESRPISGDVMLTLGKGGVTLASIVSSSAAKGVSAEGFDALLLMDQLPPASGKWRGR